MEQEHTRMEPWEEFYDTRRCDALSRLGHIDGMHDAPFQIDLIVGIASGTVRLISVGSVDSASSGFHCVMTKACPG